MQASEQKNKCKHIESVILTGVETPWPEQVRRQIEAHVKDCPGCAELFEIQQTLIGGPSVLSAPFESTAIKNKLLAELNESAEKRPGRTFYLTLGAAAILLVLFSLFPRRQAPQPADTAGISSNGDVFIINQIEIPINQGSGLSLADDTSFVRFTVPAF